jgi:hypothetical protein
VKRLEKERGKERVNRWGRWKRGRRNRREGGGRKWRRRGKDIEEGRERRREGSQV